MSYLVTNIHLFILLMSSLLEVEMAY